MTGGLHDREGQPDFRDFRGLGPRIGEVFFGEPPDRAERRGDFSMYAQMVKADDIASIGAQRSPDGAPFDPAVMRILVEAADRAGKSPDGRARRSRPAGRRTS